MTDVLHDTIIYAEPSNDKCFVNISQGNFIHVL